ncbi:MAG: ABC transporter ATP-binding protein/permease [Gemmatimonadetes bacterium]|nr:ABC transporter ATP-binding protein/permease [Gemmatimonadota bacterium]
MRSLTPLLPYLRPHRRVYVLGGVCVALGSVFATLGPVAVKYAVDAMREGADWERIAQWAAAVLALALVQAVFRYFQRRLVYDAAREVETDLRDDLFATMVRQPPAFFDALPTGDVLSRFTNDVNAVRMALGPGVMFGVNTLTTLALAIGFMAWIDTELTVWALLPLPFVSVAVKVMGRKIHERSEAAQAALADVSTAVQENLAGLRVVRAYGREETERESFGQRSEAYVERNMRLATIQAVLSPLLGFLLGASLLILLYVGGLRVARGTLTLGDFVAFTMYLGMVGWPLVAFGWIANLFQRAAAAMGRVNAILLARPAIDDRNADPGGRPTAGGIAFRDVTFRYGPGLPAVLDGVTLEIEPGLTVGLTGPTGGGKTTLVSLIPRLYDASGGRVEVDGRPVAEYPLTALRGAIGMAPQEPFLFSDTVRANLEFAGTGGDAITTGEAAGIAGLAGDVERFPEGFETPVGERGVTLSGGQKQRAALARALLADPAILILDDAFSSVDTETEERILDRLRDYRADRTTILVSHRVSTLRHADRIVVLAGGRVVEEGPHAELVAGGGWYADLDRRQRLEAEIESA